MRDFRDAKVMAHTLRSALAAKGTDITISQSLELIAQAFGVADWNSLSARIRAEADTLSDNARSPRFPAIATMHRAITYAHRRRHRYATLEHLLLALIDDADAAAVMKACKVNLSALREKLIDYIDNDLQNLEADDDGGDPKRSAAFQRVFLRAGHYAEGWGHPARTGAELLLAIFAETDSPAARLLGEKNMTRQDAVNVIVHRLGKRGIDVKAGGECAFRSHPAIVSDLIRPGIPI